MKTIPAAGVVSGLMFVVAAGAVHAATPQPPMNNFLSAFYRCDNNGAFNMAYDDKRPKTATMTTSNNSKTYDLKRVASQSGVAFEGGAVKFSTDGAVTKVEGAEVPLENCKVQN